MPPPRERAIHRTLQSADRPDPQAVARHLAAVQLSGPVAEAIALGSRAMVSSSAEEITSAHAHLAEHYQRIEVGAVLNDLWHELFDLLSTPIYWAAIEAVAAALEAERELTNERMQIIAVEAAQAKAAEPKGVSNHG